MDHDTCILYEEGTDDYSNKFNLSDQTINILSHIQELGAHQISVTPEVFSLIVDHADSRDIWARTKYYWHKTGDSIKMYTYIIEKHNVIPFAGIDWVLI